MVGAIQNNELARMWKRALASQSGGTNPAHSATVVNIPGRPESSVSTQPARNLVTTVLVGNGR